MEGSLINMTKKVHKHTEKKIQEPVETVKSEEVNENGMHGGNQKFAIIFVFLVIIVIAIVGWESIQQAKMPQSQKIVIQKQELVKRSKDLGLVSRALTGSAIDVNTGTIVKAVRIFSPDDKTVYLELDFNSAPVGTVVDYIRYKDGRYVDHGEITIAKLNTKNILFDWTISKLLANLRNGKWKVATYTNGVLAKRILYEIQNNKVSAVYQDEAVNEFDSDYQLNHALAIGLAHPNSHD